MNVKWEDVKQDYARKDAEIAELKAENNRLQAAWEQAASQSTMYEGELRKVTAFHMLNHLTPDPLYAVKARNLIGSLEGVKAIS